MTKPARSRVLLITGSHVSAFDFNLLLENLSHEQAPGEHAVEVRRRRLRRGGHDGWCGTAWASEDDLAPAREFINRQFGAGEPWFCYVKPCLPPASGRRATLVAGQRARDDRPRSRNSSSPPKPGRSR